MRRQGRRAPAVAPRHALCALALCGMPVAAATLAVPLPFTIVEGALIEQVFIGPDQTARVLEGKNACNSLTLSEPRITAGANGNIRVLTLVTSKGGTPLTKGRCLRLFEWSGTLEAQQSPYGLPGRPAIGFRMIDSRVLRRDGEQRAVPGIVWDWIKKRVHPRLAGFTIDLSPLREATRVAITALPAADAVTIMNSFAVSAVGASANTLTVDFALDIPPPPPTWHPPVDEPPLTIEELERWRATWQQWDSFATWLIKVTASKAGADTARALGEVLLNARYELAAALEDDSGRDPVPALFLSTWTRLAPLLKRVLRGLPSQDAMRLLSFITAADAMAAIDSVAPHFGFRLDRASLRRLARVLVPQLEEAVLEYSIDVDPVLRELLGFAQEFPLAVARETEWYSLLIRSAVAAPRVDPTLAQRLDRWVPQARDLDAYLKEVSRLFDQVAGSEGARQKLPVRFDDVYQPLLRATAWQETCWRQYILKNGQIQTIRSPSGSVGIMQVNTHVWRGVYNLNKLVHDIGYNARAGNEIVIHYLVDYAIKKREHEQGGLENLARATYAAYHGGPSHLTRYRQPGTREALRKIDAAFFNKYRAVQANGATAVKQCYGY